MHRMRLLAALFLAAMLVGLIARPPLPSSAQSTIPRSRLSACCGVITEPKPVRIERAPLFGLPEPFERVKLPLITPQILSSGGGFSIVNWHRSIALA